MNDFEVKRVDFRRLAVRIPALIRGSPVLADLVEVQLKLAYAQQYPGAVYGLLTGSDMLSVEWTAFPDPVSNLRHAVSWRPGDRVPRGVDGVIVGVVTPRHHTWNYPIAKSSQEPPPHWEAWSEADVDAWCKARGQRRVSDEVLVRMGLAP